VWGIGTTFSKLLLNEVSEKAGIVLRYYGATVLAFMAIFVLGKSDQIITVAPTEIGRLIFIAFTTGLAAMYLYYKGLKVTQAKVATIMELTFPLLAVFVDMFLYKTFLAPTQYLAAGVLLFAMYRVSKIQKALG
nr:DMT family transporter [Candidatus Woesebacteria bacterium]